jgi:hypothetical protein
MNCFAHSKTGCTILRVKACRAERCSFRKTKAQLQSERQLCAARIASLDVAQKMYIVDKYYAAKLPTPKEATT